MRAMGCINGFSYCADSIAITGVPFKPDGRLGKARSDFRRYRLRFDLRWIGGIARRPHPRFLALDRERAMHRELMLDVETRTAELAHPRRELDNVTEPRRSEKARASADQR